MSRAPGRGRIPANAGSRSRGGSPSRHGPSSSSTERSPTGFAFNRELLLLYICTGLLAASIGQGRRMLYVIRDWLPFALVLVAYDLSRGAADSDRAADDVALAGRRRSLVVLRHGADGVAAGTTSSCPTPPWWESRHQHRLHVVLHPAVRGRRVCCGCAIATNGRRSSGCSSACRSRRWSSTRCCPPHRRGPPPGAPPPTSQGGPSDPRCMFRPARGVPDGGLLGAMQTTQDGANGWVERIVGRGLGQAEPAHRQRADRPGPGKRQPGGGDPVAARRA